MRFNEWYIDMLSMFDTAGFVQERHDKISLTQMHYETDLAKDGLPLLYLKPTPWRLAISELLWFISSSYDYADLHNEGCTWWEPWLRSIAPADYDWQERCIAPLFVDDYSLPYKKHNAAFKRIANALLDGDFDSTRLYCNLWPAEHDLHKAALPPCALAYQVTVEHGRVNMSVTQRSADLLCGVPTNVLQYAFLTHLYARIAGLQVGTLLMNFGDLHVYKVHKTQPEWQELLSDHRAADSNSMAYADSPDSFAGWGNFALPGEMPDPQVYHAKSLSLAGGTYAHCGKLDFPVVQVHVKEQAK